ncbi:DUF7848 domain-containing protein [Streptomyces gelaticus]
MTRSVVKYVPYHIRSDETAEGEFEARCVFGDERECGAESGLCHSPAEVEGWQRRHTQETRHTRYRRVAADYQIWEPTQHVPASVPVSEEAP